MPGVDIMGAPPPISTRRHRGLPAGRDRGHGRPRRAWARDPSLKAEAVLVVLEGLMVDKTLCPCQELVLLCECRCLVKHCSHRAERPPSRRGSLSLARRA